MKTSINILLILSILFTSLSTGAKVQLELAKGQRIAFSYNKNKLKIHKSNFPRYNYEIDDNYEIELQVRNKLDENKYIIDVFLKRYIFNNYDKNRADVHFDSMFPPEDDETLFLRFPSFNYGLLCNLEITVGLDLQKNEIVLLENEQRESKIRSIIISSGFNDEATKDIVDQIDDEVIKITTIVEEYLLRFNNAFFQKKDAAQIDKNDNIVSRTDDYIRLKSSRDFEKDGRKNHEKRESALCVKSGLLNEMYIETVENPIELDHGRMSATVIEKETYLLIKDSNNYSDSVKISGTILNPVCNQVQVRILNFPVGLDKKIYSAKLNHDNQFSIEIPFYREGFITVLNSDNTTIKWSSSTIVIYAEPGDSIDFTDGGSTKENLIVFNADRKIENDFIQQGFADKLNIGIMRRGIVFPLMNSRHTEEFINKSASIIDFINSEKLQKDDLPFDSSGKFKRFFINENEMHKLLLATSLLRFYYNVEAESESEKVAKIFSDLRYFVKNFEIMRYYEEYGHFSRGAMFGYVDYRFNKNSSYSNSSMPFKQGVSPFWKQYVVRYDKSRVWSYMKLILTGSALAREQVSFLKRNFSSSNRYSNYGDLAWFGGQKELAKQVLSSSKDTNLNAYIETEIEKAETLFSGRIYEERLFLTKEGDSVSINDFLGEKACVINIATDWAQNRYLFDEISEKHPDVNAIVINEGVDYSEWLNYIEKADAKAIQLFLKNEKQNLGELFFRYYHHSEVIVFDSNGELLDFRADIYRINSYIEKAKNPLPKKKEVNKSTLIGIIWFLGGSLLVFLLGFLIFKFKMHQKIRKQKREKRLSELQLSAIRAQMNPHFLFNSLNSVQNLIQKQKGTEAHLYLSDLSGLIRRVMKNSQHEEISLAEELDTLNQYIKLEQLRFDFEYTQSVDPLIDQNHFMIPSMILQPVAENAILHGLQNKKGDKRLSVEVFKQDKTIQIKIEDNGIGLEASKKIKKNSNGIGLNLNEERLKIMQDKYGGNYSFKLIDLFAQNREGTRIEIIIPEEV